MEVQFFKYHGAGNDFILIDNRDNVFNSNPYLVKKLCDRRFGIGADGLMLLENSQKADFSMRYFNSDGHESTMCGNGGRCIALFAWHKGIISEETEFFATDGLHKVRKLENDEVALQMNPVEDVKVIENNYFLNTGSPHYVLFVNGLENYNVFEEGRKLRYDTSISEQGTNVDFVEVITNNEIAVRTYERGVENETLACGTGAVASAIGTHLTDNSDNFSFTIRARGGTLKVDFKREKENRFTDIWLTGPAKYVFKGTVEV
jgi:diaminopimelate epimerase